MDGRGCVRLTIKRTITVCAKDEEEAMQKIEEFMRMLDSMTVEIEEE